MLQLALQVLSSRPGIAPEGSQPLHQHSTPLLPRVRLRTSSSLLLLQPLAAYAGAADGERGGSGGGGSGGNGSGGDGSGGGGGSNKGGSRGRGAGCCAPSNDVINLVSSSDDDEVEPKPANQRLQVGGQAEGLDLVAGTSGSAAAERKAAPGRASPHLKPGTLPG